MRKESVEAVLIRLSKALGVETDTALAKALRTTSSTVSSWKARESIPYAKCVEVSQQRGVSIDWLLTGDGPMIKGQSHTVTDDDLTPRQKAVLGLFDALPEDKQREILSALEDKKRMQDLEENYKELKEALDALKNTG